MYIFCFLERWNFIVSLHLRKQGGESKFFCAGSILTKNLGEKFLLVLTDTGHSSQIIILRLLFSYFVQVFVIQSAM